MVTVGEGFRKWSQDHLSSALSLSRSLALSLSRSLALSLSRSLALSLSRSLALSLSRPLASRSLPSRALALSCSRALALCLSLSLSIALCLSLSLSMAEGESSLGSKKHPRQNRGAKGRRGETTQHTKKPSNRAKTGRRNDAVV